MSEKLEFGTFVPVTKKYFDDFMSTVTIYTRFTVRAGFWRYVTHLYGAYREKDKLVMVDAIIEVNDTSNDDYSRYYIFPWHESGSTEIIIKDNDRIYGATSVARSKNMIYETDMTQYTSHMIVQDKIDTREKMNAYIEAKQQAYYRKRIEEDEQVHDLKQAIRAAESNDRWDQILSELNLPPFDIDVVN